MCSGKSQSITCHQTGGRCSAENFDPSPGYLNISIEEEEFIPTVGDTTTKAGNNSPTHTLCQENRVPGKQVKILPTNPVAE